MCSGHPGQPVFIEKVDEALRTLTAVKEKKALPLITASVEELGKMSIKELKAILSERGINFDDLREKSELVERISESCRTVTFYA